MLGRTVPIRSRRSRSGVKSLVSRLSRADELLLDPLDLDDVRPRPENQRLISLSSMVVWPVKTDLYYR